MARRIQLRRGTAAEWAAADPILATGEIGLEIDGESRRLKIGPGRWSDLDYWAGEGGGASVQADWAAVSGDAEILNKPALGTAAAADVGTTAGTVAAGDDARFHSSVTLGASLTDVLGLTGQALSAVDAGADRIIFWDDSANKAAYLQVNTGLQITGTVLTVDSTVATLSGAQTLTNKTLGDLKEGTYTISDGPSVDLDPVNGPLQKWVLGANRSPTAANFVNGQSVKLKIGGNYVITYPSVVWVGTVNGSNGSPPDAPTSGFLHVELWKEDNVLYGSFVGYSAT